MIGDGNHWYGIQQGLQGQAGLLGQVNNWYPCNREHKEDVTLKTIKEDVDKRIKMLEDELAKMPLLQKELDRLKKIHRAYIEAMDDGK